MPFRSCWLVVGILFLVSPLLHADGISPQEYAARRQRVIAQMPDSSIAVFQAASPSIRSNDTEYEYRQSSDLLYLTGIEEPGVVLLLAKGDFCLDEAPVSEILFFTETSAKQILWKGPGFSGAEASALGFGCVKSLSDTFAIAEQILSSVNTVFFQTDAGSKTNAVGFLADLNQQITSSSSSNPLQIMPAGQLVSNLRRVKSKDEVVLIRQAVKITELALQKAILATKPDLYEYEVEATVEYFFKREGAEYPSFPSIIAAGSNATILHYDSNRGKMVSGDLLLLDVGAEYRGYAADITRTIPVSGRFTKAQRQVYDIVLKAQEKALEAVRPGVPFKEPHRIAKQYIADAGFGDFFPHGTSHYLGIDVHDVGDSKIELRPGVVLTVEPGIYIPDGSAIDKRYWGIGIRIEDDVLVTEDGYEVLSASLPRQADEIEMLMKGAGAPQIPE